MAGEEPRRQGDGGWRRRRKVVAVAYYGRVEAESRWGIDRGRSGTHDDTHFLTRDLPEKVIGVGVARPDLGKKEATRSAGSRDGEVSTAQNTMS